MTRGRKHELTGKMIEHAERLGGMGLKLMEIANVLDIAPSTLSRYRRRFPEFDLALTRGKDKADTKVVNCLFKNATEKMNYNAQVFWLKNRLPEVWKDKTEVDHTGKVTLEHEEKQRIVNNLREALISGVN